MINFQSACQRLVGDQSEAVSRLLHVDRGVQGSHMRTHGLHQVVNSNQSYVITHGQVRPSKELFASDLEERATRPENIVVPPFVSFAAQWLEEASISGSGNNILGDNGLLVVEQTILEVPVIEATDAQLAYYGATLVHPEEIVRFPGNVYPLFLMNIGEKYVEDFIMSHAGGGGFYLESHSDQPHFHLSLKGGGYYLLARWNEEHTHLQLTGFRIPDGLAVYTKKGAIHCDAALTGDFIVGYTISHDCSTVLLRHGSNYETLVSLEFEVLH